MLFKSDFKTIIRKKAFDDDKHGWTRCMCKKMYFICHPLKHNRKTFRDERPIR